ncbi:hypothetical protein GYMLUDRAFT_271462 [Collybiopsis luxurians FD-317 M1]|nr:hypothetical protein GYMLUDRAFT_271462 [Collybiopsis luxurians FD-317 M1]
MFHFQPTLVSSDIGYSRPQLPRSRYISSLADIRAAEVAECEERDLLRRLEEIQLQKQQDRFIRSRPQSLYSDSYSPYYANAFEDEELELAARRRQERLQLEYLRRKAEEEARLLALKRSEEELKLKQLALLREEEESRLHSLRREVEQLEAKKRQKVSLLLIFFFPDANSDFRL